MNLAFTKRRNYNFLMSVVAAINIWRLVLNGFLVLLPLVVVPGELRILSQNTAIKLSRVDPQFERHGAAVRTNNFLLVKFDSAGVKP